MSVEINENTRLRLGIKDAVYIGVMIVGITVSYITTRMATEYQMANITMRLEKIEKVEPEKMQWQISSLTENVKEIKDNQTKQSELIQKIYNLLNK